MSIDPIVWLILYGELLIDFPIQGMVMTNFMIFPWHYENYFA